MQLAMILGPVLFVNMIGPVDLDPFPGEVE
jgi:hypothetical protein